MQKDYEMLRVLVELGADINFREAIHDGGYAPLHRKWYYNGAQQKLNTKRL